MSLRQSGAVLGLMLALLSPAAYGESYPLNDMNMESVQENWQSWVDKNRANRQKETSSIYWDVALRLYSTDEKPMMTHISHHNRGAAINKYDRHENRPEFNSPDKTYIGHVFPNEDGRPGYSFYGADGRVVPLVHHERVHFPEMNMSLELRETSRPYVKVFNYNRPYADLHANPKFYPFSSDWVV
ncbi:MAG: hypothetical protein MJK18_02390, partial [Bdellovibrionales bacterium]|nr:hypothetical protein [Bdellovibrionales bacterium]